jgi:FtsP/CotA-like multicopper oxidase with cupredoxin domain
MNANRRQFLQASGSVIATAAAAETARAADPFAEAAPGLGAQWFNKGLQHILPRWAFSQPLAHIPPSPKESNATSTSGNPTATWEDLAIKKGAPFKAVENDARPVGMVLHGTAVEWNGKIIGGNKMCKDGTWGDASSAWEAMRERVKPDTANSSFGDLGVGNWGKFGAQDNAGKGSLVRCYKVVMQEMARQLRPDANGRALLYSYDGLVPGPTFRFRHGMPVVVRFENRLQTETSIHHHGGHNPTHSDGFPTYYVLQGEARDYLYPNILPLRFDPETTKTEIDFGEGQSTTWYHDHGLDATAFNVSHGLSGVALWFDDLELNLIKKGVLPGYGLILKRDATGKPIPGAVELESLSAFDGGIPNEKAKLSAAWIAWRKKSPTSYWSKRYAMTLGKEPRLDPDEPVDVDLTRYHRETQVPYFNPYDIPLVLQDRIVDLGTGQIVYDANGHNGYIGNTQLVSGKAWPKIVVKSRKYRLRVLDGSNSRIYRLRFLDADTFGLQPNAAGELVPANLPGPLDGRSMEFLRIGKDSWMWPMPQKRKSIILNMANRADLIVDFKVWYDEAKRAGRLTPEGHAEYYMVNTMPQFDGRGPKSKLAEDAGDPAVFPLPFTVDPANTVVANMANAGIIPPGFLAPPPRRGQAQS